MTEIFKTKILCVYIIYKNILLLFQTISFFKLKILSFLNCYISFWIFNNIHLKIG